MRTAKGLVLALALLLVAGVTATAFAQEQTGGIQGTVKDSSGGVLPGVTVEARNVSAAGVQTAVTDEKGVYRFPALPPGTYEVTATLQGFNPAKVGNAALVLGKILTVDLALSVGAVSQSVEVKGEAPLIDVTQNATFSTIQKDTIDRIPKGRDFQTILKTAPGAQEEARANGIQVDGASGTENRFVIDGMDTTSMSNGASGKTMLLDFIQEVQVKSSGYNAEFGGATGGVVSAITKSGTNQIRGQGGLYYESNANSFMAGTPRKYNRYDPFVTANTNADYLTPDTPWTQLAPIGDIGGPILKDKLWYYFGAGYTKNNYNEDVTFYLDPNRVRRHFDWWSDQKFYNYNVSYQASNNLRVRFSGQNQRNANRGTAPAFEPQDYKFPDGTIASTPYTRGTFDKNPDGSVNQDAYDSRWVRQGSNSPTDIYSGSADWVVTNSFFVNASGGWYRTNTTTPPGWRGNELRHTFSNSNTDATMTAAGFPTVPAQYQQASGYADKISSSGTIRDQYTRAFMNANTTFFKSMAGQHTFKVGVRFERVANDALLGNAKPTVNLFWGQKTSNTAGQTVAGTYGYYTITQAYTGGKVASNNWAYWIQDSWNVNPRLTVNAGVRFENETLPAYNTLQYGDTAVAIKWGFADKLAPRAGFAYDLKGNGRWKAYGSFGWYYAIMPLSLARVSMGGTHNISYYYTLNTPDWASISCEAAAAGCPGTFANQVDFNLATNLPNPAYANYFGIPNMSGIDQNVKPVKSGEFTAGLDHQLSPVMSLGVRYVHKWAIRAIDDVGVDVPGVGELFVLTNPGEGFGEFFEPTFPTWAESKPKRDYDAIEVKLTRRLSNHWSGTASYVWSRLFGNWTGLTSGDEPAVGNSNLGRSAAGTTRYWDNMVMSYDSHGDQVYGVLPTDRPHSVKLAGTYEFKTGTSVGGFYLIESGAPQSTIVRIGGRANGYPMFVNGRNDLGRTPTYSQFDLVATQEFRLGKSMRALIQMNIDNLFDQDAWTAYFNVFRMGPEPYRDPINMTVPSSIIFNDNGFDLQALAASYTGTLRTNAFYKTPNTFQNRRSTRLSVKFTF
jgi:hypothetical protein